MEDVLSVRMVRSQWKGERKSSQLGGRREILWKERKQTVEGEGGIQYVAEVGVGKVKVRIKKLFLEALEREYFQWSNRAGNQLVRN